VNLEDIIRVEKSMKKRVKMRMIVRMRGRGIRPDEGTSPVHDSMHTGFTLNQMTRYRAFCTEVVVYCNNMVLMPGLKSSSHVYHGYDSTKISSELRFTMVFLMLSNQEMPPWTILAAGWSFLQAILAVHGACSNCTRIPWPSVTNTSSQNGS
jgi:hypothetical protein